MKNPKHLIPIAAILLIGLIIILYYFKPDQTGEQITVEQKEILTFVDSILINDTSFHDTRESKLNNLKRALSKPIDAARAIQMKKEVRDKLKYGEDFEFINPQISVNDLLTYVTYFIGDDYLNAGLLVYPALEGNKLIHIICITREFSKDSDIGYYKFSNIDYRYQNTMLAKDAISREQALALIKAYYDKVTICNTPQRDFKYYKTSHFYKLDDIEAYLDDNGYYAAAELESKQYFLELNHGYITDSMMEDFFKIGGRFVVKKAEDLIGYSCFLELYDKIGSVTRSAPIMGSPKRMFGIEEIAKPCPPRCDDFGGITRKEFYP